MISGAMNNIRLDSIIREHSTIEEGQLGFWRISYQDRVVMVVTDENHNRMRIISPVVEVAELDESIWLIALTANFDRALDARYAVNGDYLWSAYIHPLSSCSEGQFVDGLNQVVTLADTFGTTFTSSDLVFGGGGED
ncbi:MAG: hypothetical protein ABJZ55_26195 [Fuerstiella sp.]